MQALGFLVYIFSIPTTSYVKIEWGIFQIQYIEYIDTCTAQIIV